MKQRASLPEVKEYSIRIKGFTLIELIVVVLIMLVLLAFTLVNYSSYNDSQKVKQAALTLKSDLHLARTNAASGKKPVECDLDTLVGYKVTIASTMYTIVPQCSSLGEIVSEKKEVTLPTGMSFTPLPSPASFTYYPLTRGIFDAPTLLTLTDGTTTIALTVDDTGASIITATPTPTTSLSTSTPTPTATVTPSPTPSTCDEHCVQQYGWNGTCIGAGICDASVLPHANEGTIYDCIPLSPKICCCVQ